MVRKEEKAIQSLNKFVINSLNKGEVILQRSSDGQTIRINLKSEDNNLDIDKASAYFGVASTILKEYFSLYKSKQLGRKDMKFVKMATPDKIAASALWLAYDKWKEFGNEISL